MSYLLDLDVLTNVVAIPLVAHVGLYQSTHLVKVNKAMGKTL